MWQHEERNISELPRHLMVTASAIHKTVFALIVYPTPLLVLCIAAKNLNVFVSKTSTVVSFQCFGLVIQEK